MPELFTGDTITAAMSTASAPPSSDAPPASDPSSAAAEASSAAETAATTQAAAGGTTGTTDSDPKKTATETTEKGIPPEKRWPTILENARTKAASEVKAQYAWADRIPEPHRATVGEFYETLETAPVQAIEALIATAANDPVHAPQLRSLLGRLLRGGSTEHPASVTAAAPKAATLPEPDFQDEQGHQFYSADRIRELADTIEARLDAKYSRELDPLKTDFQTREARGRMAKAKQDADQWADARYAKVSQWPEFQTYETEIAKALQADPDLDVGDAYVDIVVPHLSQAERKKVVTSLQDKVKASSVNPATPASAVGAPPKDFREAAQQMWGSRA